MVSEGSVAQKTHTRPSAIGAIQAGSGMEVKRKRYTVAAREQAHALYVVKRGQFPNSIDHLQ